MNMRDSSRALVVGVLFAAAACADRFGNVGEMGGASGEAGADAHPSSNASGASACPPDTMPPGECPDGTLRILKWDAAGCPIGYRCAVDDANPPPNSTPAATTATCITNGCWTECAFVDGGGGAPNTQIVGSTSCAGSGTGGVPTTTVIGNAVCFSNGCWTRCDFSDGGGGAPTTRVVGGTSCENPGMGGSATSTTIVVVPSGNGGTNSGSTYGSTTWSTTTVP